MLYLDHSHFKRLYLKAQKAYDSILSEKEELFSKTQPRSARLDTERVSGGSKENSFDVYMSSVERNRLDDRLTEARILMQERYKLLMQTETEIRKSKEMTDLIYMLRYIDCLKISKIAKKVGYSKSQVYRIIEQIDANIKMRQNATN